MTATCNTCGYVRYVMGYDVCPNCTRCQVGLHAWGEPSLWEDAHGNPAGAWVKCATCGKLAWIGLMPPPSHRLDDALYEERIAQLQVERIQAQHEREAQEHALTVGEAAT